QQGDELPVRRTVRLVDGDPAGPAALDELEAEPALAHACLRHHAHDAALSVERAGERRLGRSQLVGPTHEAREAAGAGAVEAAAQRAGAEQLVHVNRATHSLDARLAEVAHLEVAVDEAR